MNLQLELPFQEFSSCTSQSLDNSSTFINNMKLPVHRWFRFSAGFSAQWVETIITQAKERGETTVLDPFSGSGTTLLASEKLGVECLGIEAHPFVVRIARAKLLYQTDADAYLEHIQKVIKCAENIQPCIDTYPKLIHECFSISSLESLDRLRQSWEKFADDSSESQLVWLTLVSIIRHVSHAGTAPWQYILPNKKKQYSITTQIIFAQM
ncbi:DNA methyltransferase [Nostoc sp.]